MSTLPNSDASINDLPDDKIELIALLSHQIRGPLFNIRNAITGMREDCEPRASQYHALLAIIDRSTDRMVALTERCLRLMELKDRRASLHEQQGDCLAELRHLIFRTVDSLSEENDLSSLHIETCIDKHVPQEALVQADSFLLEQALANLIANAIQYGFSSSKTDLPNALIELTFSAEENHYRIAVTDFGAGISESHKNLVFRPFYRIPSSTLLRKTGTGLGLSIVKTIVDSFGGSVGLESRQGQGSTFWFTLKAANNCAAEE